HHVGPEATGGAPPPGARRDRPWTGRGDASGNPERFEHQVVVDLSGRHLASSPLREIHVGETHAYLRTRPSKPEQTRWLPSVVRAASPAEDRPVRSDAVELDPVLRYGEAAERDMLPARQRYLRIGATLPQVPREGHRQAISELLWIQRRTLTQAKVPDAHAIHTHP